MITMMKRSQRFNLQPPISYLLPSPFYLLPESVPCFPDVGAVADGRLLAVADNRRAEHGGVVQQLFLHRCFVGEVGAEILLVCLGFFVNEIPHAADSVPDAGVFAAAHAEADNINKLILDSAFLEITLGFLCVKAFSFAEYLYVHDKLLLYSSAKRSFSIIYYLFVILYSLSAALLRAVHASAVVLAVESVLRGKLDRTVVAVLFLEVGAEVFDPVFFGEFHAD